MIDPSIMAAVERHRAAWPVPGHLLPLHTWRERYESQVLAVRPPPPEGVDRVDRIVGALDVGVRVYRPTLPGLLPGLVYLHGGGWVLGSVESHNDITAAIARDAGCVVISVDYSRAPENPFPRAFQETLAVLNWLKEHCADLRVDRHRLFVGGDSAGGNLAAALALAASEDEAPLAGQVLLYPCVDTDFKRMSFVSGRDAPFLSSDQMEWFWDRYLPTPSARQDPFAVPMRATDAQLRLVAPAFLATAEHDPLHDEGRAYAERLRTLGVPTEYEPGPGMVHGFIRLRDAAPEPSRIYRAMCTWIRQSVVGHDRARSGTPGILTGPQGLS